jgi:hypothetical protein
MMSSGALRGSIMTTVQYSYIPLQMDMVFETLVRLFPSSFVHRTLNTQRSGGMHTDTIHAGT